MQIQPSNAFRIEAVPYRLPALFPVEWLGHHVQGDADVTYLHFHNCIEIGYCYEGSGLFFVDDQVYPYTKGDACIIFRNQLHLAQSMKGHVSRWHFAFVDPEKWLAIVGGAELAGLFRKPHAFPHILSSKEHPKPVGLVEAVMEELEKKEYGYENAVKGLVWSLLVMAGRLGRPHREAAGHGGAGVTVGVTVGVSVSVTVGVSVSVGVGVDPDMDTGEKDGTPARNRTGLMRLAAALEHISRHYIEPIPIGKLSSLCGMSTTHFRRVFTGCLGVPPLEYIIKVRVQMASALLANTDYSILDISYQSGFTTLSSFNRHFKRLMGASPHQWRNVRPAGE